MGGEQRQEVAPSVAKGRSLWTKSTPQLMLQASEIGDHQIIIGEKGCSCTATKIFLSYIIHMGKTVDGGE